MPLQQISVSPLNWVKENANVHSQNQDWKVQEPVFTTSGQHAPERCASQASTLSNNHDICRICHCEGDNEVPLIAPCYCAGSLRYVHQACLQQWIKSSDIRSCELCKFQFIMQSKIKPFSEWESLEMTGVERRKLLCSVTFHAVALTCVIWSLYVLIDRTAEEMSKGILEWPFWTKLIVVAIGFTGGLVFMYIQCKAYLHLCRRWKAFNRVIFVQNAPEKVPVPPSINSQPPLAREESLLASETCCGVVTSDDGGRGIKLRANEMAVSAAVDSSHLEIRGKNSSKAKDEEKNTNSLGTGDAFPLSPADGNDDIMKGVIIVDSGKLYQPLSSDTAETCGALEIESASDLESGTKVLNSRKFSYEETVLIRDRGILQNECEEMSHLLQGEDAKCENSQQNQQVSNAVLYFPGPTSALEEKGRVAVTSSSSEESLQSPSIQLLQQSRKATAMASVAGRQVQQAPTLPARPWTVGPSSATSTWLDDASSDTTTNTSRPKSSLGSQSPLLSVISGNDDTVVPKEQKHKHL